MAIRVEVWGDYALFTRPEMKTERVSYDVMTPSAARGLLESICLQDEAGGDEASGKSNFWTSCPEVIG